uniref:Putative secreted protein n=1 Tax=Anopheles marajoara TaxID=58244 RepID=A0A2M4C9B8_9DIPT
MASLTNGLALTHKRHVLTSFSTLLPSAQLASLARASHRCIVVVVVVWFWLPCHGGPTVCCTVATFARHDDDDDDDGVMFHLSPLHYIVAVPFSD